MMTPWFLQLAGKVEGPFSFARLRRLAEEGHFTMNDFVRSGANGPWVSAASVAGLFSSAAADGDAGIEHLSQHATDLKSRGTPAPTLGSGQQELQTPTDETPPAHQTAARNDQWHCRIFGIELGPMPFEDLQRMARAGELSDDDEVQLGEQTEWNPASVIANLLPGILKVRKIAHTATPDEPDKTVGQTSGDDVPTEEGPSSDQTAERLRITSESEKEISLSQRSAARCSAVPSTPSVEPSPPLHHQEQLSVRLLDTVREHRGFAVALAVWLLVNVVVVGFPMVGADNRPRYRPMERHYPLGSVDQEYADAYEAYVRIWQELTAMRERGASAWEWPGLVENSTAQVNTIVESLENTDMPEKLHLARVGKYFVIPMLQTSQTAKGQEEQLFLRHMAESKKGLQQAGYSPSPL